MFKINCNKSSLSMEVGGNAHDLFAEICASMKTLVDKLRDNEQDELVDQLSKAFAPDGPVFDADAYREIEKKFDDAHADDDPLDISGAIKALEELKDIIKGWSNNADDEVKH